MQVVIDGALTDDLLRALLQMGPHIHNISADSLELHSDQHTNTPCSWWQLSIDELDLAQAANLPVFSDGECCVECDNVTIDEGVVEVGKRHRRTRTHREGRCTHTMQTMQAVWLQAETADGRLGPTRRTMGPNQVSVCVRVCVYVCVCHTGV